MPVLVGARQGQLLPRQQARRPVAPVVRRAPHTALRNTFDSQGPSSPVAAARRAPRALRAASPRRAAAPPAAPAAASGGDGKWRWEESQDAVVAYGVLMGVLAAGTIPVVTSQQWADLPYFIALALCTQYIGAHRGLTTKQRQQISLKVNQSTN